MTFKTREDLLAELEASVRSAGSGTKTTAKDVRNILTSLIDELLARTENAGGGSPSSDKNFDYVSFTDFQKDGQGNRLAYTFEAGIVYYDTYLGSFFRCLVTHTTSTEYPAAGLNFELLVVASTKKTDELTTQANAIIAANQRPFTARGLTGNVYAGTATDTTASDLATANTAIGDNGIITMNRVYDMPTNVFLRPGTWIDGNKRYFRLNGHNLYLDRQCGIKDLHVENYIDTFYVSTIVNRNNRETPRVENCDLYVPIYANENCFIRIIDSQILYGASAWNVGPGTIILEGATTAPPPAVGPGFATIIDRRATAVGVPQSYVDDQDRALDARIDALEAGSSAQSPISLKLDYKIGQGNTIQIPIITEISGTYNSISTTNVAATELKKNNSIVNLPISVINGDTLTVSITRSDAAQASSVTATTVKSFSYSSQVIVTPTPSELLVNPSFDDQSGWNLASGWTIANGVAIGSGNDNRMSQLVNLIGGTTYIITIESNGITDGGIYFIFENPNNFAGAGYMKLTGPTNTINYTPTQNETRLFSIKTNQGGGTISSASLRIAN